MFNAAKIVADCFKFRNKVGLDVTLEALREAWWGKKVAMDASGTLPPSTGSANK